MTTWDILEKRGIADAAKAAGWEMGQKHDRDGWVYPIQSTKTPGQKRWKAATNGKGQAKYLWYQSGLASRPIYYFVNGIKAAIESAGGTLYLAGGEPDVLVYVAAGAHNVLCWFGEMSIPDSLVSDLQALGVTKLVYAHDRDQTGKDAAEAVAETLKGTGIEFIALALTDELESHYDVNSLWMDCEFDPAEFWRRFHALPVVGLAVKHAHIDWNREYTEWCEAVEAEAVKRWRIDTRQQTKDNVVWSKTLFSSPTRSDSDPSARWSYTQHGFKDFGPNVFYNTHEVAALLDFETWNDRKARLVKEAESGPVLYGDLDKHAPQHSAGTGAPEPGNDVRVVTSDEAMTTVMSWLEGKLPPTEPILSPYGAMHQLGGMAELWEPRKLIYVIGAAGMGKTAFMETGADALRRRGLSVIYWGPEWSPEEVQMKTIARYGGPSFSKQRKAHLWEMEQRMGLPKDKCHGEPLTEDEQQKAYKLACQVLAWPGKAYYIDRADLPMGDMAVKVQEITAKAREEGHKPVAFFCDYLQKAKLPGSMGRWDELENKANVISYAVISANLVGVVASQVGKANSRQARKNTRLDGGSAQGLSDQLPNLYITLNPVFDHDGNRLEKGVISVEKNSSGYAPGQVIVKTALYRHYWSDEATSVDVETQFGGSTFAARSAGDDDSAAAVDGAA